MFKRILGVLLIVGLTLGGVGALHHSAPQRAEASVDSWSGHPESLVTFSQSLTLGAPPAVLYTAVSGVRPNIRAITITDSASGVVTLYDGPGGTGATVIAQFGVLANSPIFLDEDRLGVGIRATLSNGVYIGGATGTVTATARIRVGGQ